MTSKIKLKKFDMKKLKDDSVVVLLGKRRTGKSVLVKDILHSNKDIPCGVIISPTEEASPFFVDFVPHIFLFPEYDKNIIGNVIKRQKKARKKFNRNPNIDPRAFLIMDDCLANDDWKKDKIIREVFMNGRHYKLLFLLTMQYPLGITPMLRTNVDFVFILRDNLLSNRKRIFDHWAGMFPNFKIFCKVMDQCTQNYECLVIDNTSKSNDFQEIVYWYKADPREFRIGHKMFWDKAAITKRNTYDDDDDQKTSGVIVNKLDEMGRYS